MQEAQPHCDETGRGWHRLLPDPDCAASARLQNRDRRPARRDVRGPRWPSRRPHGPGWRRQDRVPLEPMCAPARSCQLELDVAKMAPDARRRDAEIPGKRPLQRAAERLLGVRQPAPFAIDSIARSCQLTTSSSRSSIRGSESRPSRSRAAAESGANCVKRDVIPASASSVSASNGPSPAARHPAAASR